jgi:hypothetical protein
MDLSKIDQDKYKIQTPEEKRKKEFKILVNQIVTNKLGKQILALDDIAEKQGIDAAFGAVGDIISNAVIAGLEFQAKKIQKLQKKIEELEKEKEK